MGTLPASIATAVGLFAGTNIDDVLVLALLSASSRAGGRPKRWEIWAGQYAGFAVLVGLAFAAGRGLALVPERWLWLLALVPFGMGVGTLVAAVREARQGAEPAPPSPGGALGIAGLTIADGADDIAAYTPFFATSAIGPVTVTLVVFAACVALWCLAGAWLTRHKRITSTLERYGRWILPAVFILLGCYVLNETAAPFHL